MLGHTPEADLGARKVSKNEGWLVLDQLDQFEGFTACCAIGAGVIHSGEARFGLAGETKAGRGLA